MGLTWERVKVILSCGCMLSNPDGLNWLAFYPGEIWACSKHGEATIKRMSRVTQK